MTVNPNNLWRITMKALMFILLPVVAFAQTSTILPEPTLHQMLPNHPTCAAYVTPNDTITLYSRQAITGWSINGTQVYAKTYGRYPHGNCAGSRGISYYDWCGTLTWTVTFDKFGNLNPVETATYTPDPTQCAVPYWDWDWTAVFYNAIGDSATVVPEQVTYGYQKGVATLVTP